MGPRKLSRLLSPRKSAICFSPGAVVRNNLLLESMQVFVSWCKDLAEEGDKEVKVFLQHSLKEDEFAVMVEFAEKTFSHHSKNPKEVFEKVSKQIFQHLEKLEHETGKEAERLAREKGRSRHRR